MNQIEVEASDADHYKIKLRSGEVKVEMVNFIFINEIFKTVEKIAKSA